MTLLTLIWLQILITYADPTCDSGSDAVAKFLGANHSAKVWMETSQDDGKPLFISLSQKNDRLHLVFFKSREGVWAEGPALLCKENEKDATTVAKVTKKEITIGKSAPLVVRVGFAGGANFKLTPQDQGKLRISTLLGWSGTFIPSDETQLQKARSEAGG